MVPKRIWLVLFSVFLFLSSNIFALENTEEDKTVQPDEPMVGSWVFTGMVTNESGERYGYFFQVQRQGTDIYAKTALIEGQTNQLILFYEANDKIDSSSPQVNWQVGRSFIRYNPINDSWIFGVKVENEKGFNFKVDMLKQDNKDVETLVLRPGVELQTLQTSRLNGHIHIGKENKEQFVTGNNAWFGKLWFSKDQNSPHDISTIFCRLSNDNGFYSANLKEADATGAAIAGWRDPAGNNIKMSQFVSIKTLTDNQCLLSVGLPKLKLRLINTLKQEENAPLTVAGFSAENPKGFCFITKQIFNQVKESAVESAINRPLA
ncbi:hypothetical protein EP47_05495 [Legionella norrlandica]|uniref:Uncharacterized protein n=1 Tax=Legionella norrlandica TaxID=1498499 RepID=A0A0A2T830_9GAMM|nr:hypothetical protein [Legionella norrlandica]KGP63573.1 hypothetical protein EP47_05495 [Legionella norrlandica]